MLYPKINSLWKRYGWYFDEKEKINTPPELQITRQSFIVGDYACPEFATVKQWLIDEKVDGTNVRVFWNPKDANGPRFGARTENAQIPVPLLNHLQDAFTRESLTQVFPDTEVVLFGEGYGPKIQKNGGRYRSDVSFILFDAYVNGFWLEKENVIDIANKLDLEHTINQEVFTTDGVIEFVKSKPLSYIAEDPTLVMEGVIACSYPLMLFRETKTPVMFKLKVRDFPEESTELAE